MNSLERTNWYVRIIVVVLFTALCILVGVDFLTAPQKYELTPSSITLLALAAVLGLAERFDKLNLGKLLSLSREVKEVSTEQEAIRQETTKLRDSLLAVATNIQMSQRSAQNLAFGDSAIRFLGKAVSGEGEADDGEKDDGTEEDDAPPDDLTPEEGSAPKRMRYYKLYQAAIDAYVSYYELPKVELVRHAQLKREFLNQDPIWTAKLRFDAYVQAAQKEYFFYVRRIDSVNTRLNRYRIYARLSRILLYREARHSNAELILVIVNKRSIPGDTLTTIQKRVAKRFRPAIDSGLLRIIPHQFDDDEWESLEMKPG